MSHLKVRADEEDEAGSVEEQTPYDDDEDLETAFGLERFDIFSFASVAGEDRMGRNYTERDFECKRMLHIFFLPSRFGPTTLCSLSSLTG